MNFIEDNNNEEFEVNNIEELQPDTVIEFDSVHLFEKLNKIIVKLEEITKILALNGASAPRSRERDDSNRSREGSRPSYGRSGGFNGGFNRGFGGRSGSGSSDRRSGPPRNEGNRDFQSGPRRDGFRRSSDTTFAVDNADSSQGRDSNMETHRSSDRSFDRGSDRGSDRRSFPSREGSFSRERRKRF